MARTLKITQVRSYIGRPEKQRKILRSLGLGTMNRSVHMSDTPEVRGMIKKVTHLVSIEEIEVKPS